jgi:hypothetical protein
VPRDCGVTRTQWLALGMLEGQRVLERKDRLWPIMARQRVRDVLRAARAARISKPRELHRLALAGKNRADARHPGRAGDVAQHVGSLDMHLLQRVLHRLDRRGAVLKHGGPMAQVGPSRAPLGLGATRSAQQATGMPGLKPLAIHHIALAPRHMLEMARLDQVHLEAPGLQHFIDGEPIDAGRFHRHRLHPARAQPRGQRLEGWRNVPKGRTGWASRSSGTHAQTSSRPLAKPVARGLTQGSEAVRGCVGRRVRIGRPPVLGGSDHPDPVRMPFSKLLTGVCAQPERSHHSSPPA